MHRQFASDNYSGICPEAFDYLGRANVSHAVSYGDDEWTEKASDAMRELFETECEVFFVFNGTAANALALSSMCRSYNGVVCPDTAHIQNDECGAPAFFTQGLQMLYAPSPLGKLSPETLERLACRRNDFHYSKPGAISISQSTEMGTVYNPDELHALCSKSRKHELAVHMDGARFANAVAALGCKPRQISWECGVDILCFGGSKNGIAGGEAVIFFNKKYAQDFAYRCKQAGQIASKMRFLTAPWLGLLETGAWLRNGRHANENAALLESRIRSELPQLPILMPRQANALFVKIPIQITEKMHDMGWHYYTFIGTDGVRFMCSWDTTKEDIHLFIEDLKKAFFAFEK